MDKYSKSETVPWDILNLLGKPLGFNGILTLLGKKREDQGKKRVSTDTLSEALKRLQEAGYIKRDIRTRKYSLTESGEMITRDPLIASKRALRMKPRGDSKSNQMDIVKFLVDAHVRALETGGGRQNALPDSVVQHITDQVEEFAKGKVSAIEKLWTDLMSNFEGEVSSFLPVFMQMHTSYAASVPREYTPVMIDKAIAFWARFRLERIQHTISNYLTHPEVLAAIDEAIRKHSFTANLVSTPFEEVCSTLNRPKHP